MLLGESRATGEANSTAGEGDGKGSVLEAWRGNGPEGDGEDAGDGDDAILNVRVEFDHHALAEMRRKKVLQTRTPVKPPLEVQELIER